MAYYNPNHYYESLRPPVPSHYNLPPDRDIKADLDTSIPLEVLAVPVLDSNHDNADLQNVRYLGSYNWTDNATPTIIVPGSPPVWNDPGMPFRLEPDTGLRFVDQNGFRMPTSPLLPLFACIDTVRTPVDWPSVDFILDRNAMRKITRWIDIGAETRDFRIDMELAGAGTVLMNRWEPRTRDVAGNGRSYGFAFENTNTVPVQGCELSTGHYRVVQYNFCGLNIIVRFEVDTCIAMRTDLTGSREAPSPYTTAYTPSMSLNIIRAGHEVPQSSIVELKTRAVRYVDGIDWSSIYPQLYFSATSHLYLGLHERGTFLAVRKAKVSDDGGGLKAAANDSFLKLGRALDSVRKMVILHGKTKRLSLVCEKGVLKVYERSSWDDCLPNDIMGRFM